MGSGTYYRTIWDMGIYCLAICAELIFFFGHKMTSLANIIKGIPGNIY